MNSAPVAETRTGKESLAIARSKLYQLFALVMDYPDQEWADAIGAGELADTLVPMLEQVESSLTTDIDRKALTDVGEDDHALAVEYTRLFDVGPGGSPISLFGGHHQGGRTQAMEEVLRFYKHFGLTRDELTHELPDHLISELEFLHFMTFQEAKIEAQGGDASHYQRGQKDFIERQLGRWLPKLHPRLVEHEALPFYTEIVRLLEQFLLTEKQRMCKA